MLSFLHFTSRNTPPDPGLRGTVSLGSVCVPVRGGTSCTIFAAASPCPVHRLMRWGCSY